MEPRREEQPQAPPSASPKPKRFRIVKLEERIAPKKTRNTVAGIAGCSGSCGCTVACYPNANPPDW